MTAAAAAAAAALGWAAGSAVLQLVPAAEVEVEDRVVRLADVIRLDALDPEARARLGPRIVALLPAGRTGATLSRRALADLVRRGAGVAVAAGDGEEITLRLRRHAPGESCFALARPIPRGVALAAGDVAPTACRSGDRAARVRLDRAGGTVRAAEDLAEGAYLGPLTLPRPPAVRPGETVTLSSIAGPVRIDRSATALQPGRAGGRIFVRTEDGAVLAADVPERAE